MSLTDLHDLAKELHTHEEKIRTENRVRPEEFSLLAQTVLQAVHEIEDLAQAIDRAVGLTAAAAGVLASMPGADKIKVTDAKAIARQLAGARVSSDVKHVENPALQAEKNVPRIVNAAGKAAKP
jgi:MoxR-like ATPase